MFNKLTVDEPPFQGFFEYFRYFLFLLCDFVFSFYFVCLFICLLVRFFFLCSFFFKYNFNNALDIHNRHCGWQRLYLKIVSLTECLLIFNLEFGGKYTHFDFLFQWLLVCLFVEKLWCFEVVSFIEKLTRKFLRGKFTIKILEQSLKWLSSSTIC